MRLIYILILYLLGSGFICFILIRHIKTLSSEEKIKEILYYLLPIVTFSVLFIVQYILPDKIPIDYVVRHRPYLEPKLVIDSINSEKIIFYYKIQNAGEFPAKGLLFAFKQPGLSLLENDDIKRRELAPNATMRIFPTPDPLIRSELPSDYSFFHSDIIISYRSNIASRIMEF